jgi:demethylmenaquinone methyltransferase/2-methoxy-6-polyprenyl-1,4-benzoquinol methylase
VVREAVAAVAAARGCSRRRRCLCPPDRERLGTAWLHGEDEPWRLALEAIAEVRPGRVLDAGCGNAEFAALIAAPEVVCIDTSEAAVENAHRRGLAAELADIERLPFGDGEFDLVTCNYVLYHLNDVEAGVAEIARVLQPGGRFVGMSKAE